jgi:hypothetical protein
MRRLMWLIVERRTAAAIKPMITCTRHSEKWCELLRRAHLKFPGSGSAALTSMLSIVDQCPIVNFSFPRATQGTVQCHPVRQWATTRRSPSRSAQATHTTPLPPQ